MKNPNSIRLNSRSNRLIPCSKLGLKGGKAWDIKWFEEEREIAQNDFETYRENVKHDLDEFIKIRQKAVYGIDEPKSNVNKKRELEYQETKRPRYPPFNL